MQQLAMLGMENQANQLVGFLSMMNYVWTNWKPDKNSKGRLCPCGPNVHKSFDIFGSTHGHANLEENFVEVPIEFLLQTGVNNFLAFSNDKWLTQRMQSSLSVTEVYY